MLWKLREEGSDVLGQSPHGLEKDQARFVVLVGFVDASQNVGHHRQCRTCPGQILGAVQQVAYHSHRFGGD